MLWCFAHHCSSSCRICLFLRGRWLRADCLPIPAPPRYHLACHARACTRDRLCSAIRADPVGSTGPGGAPPGCSSEGSPLMTDHCLFRAPLYQQRGNECDP
ncbi:hypothetical protein BPSOL_1367 [Bifidobacterium pseudolongum]|nr:hypothetical protein BPSOL_1367 [Bifidobacterium pseudolongum]